MGAIKYTGNVSYNVVKAGVDMLSLTTAHELREHDVAVVSLWPRLTRTAGVMAHPEMFPNLDKAWSPEFNGRCVAALAADPRVIEKTGRALDVGEVANDYGLTDFDGRRVDTISEGPMIAPGAWVRCIEVKAGRVIVRQVETPPDLADMDPGDLRG